MNEENLEAFEKGNRQSGKHIENLQKFGVPVVVTLNAFSADTEAKRDLSKNSARKEDVNLPLRMFGHEAAKGAKSWQEKY